MQRVFAEITRETTGRGATVFLSSHVLSEVQHTADRVALIRDGRLQLVRGVEDLREHAFTRVEVTFDAAPPPGAFTGIRGVRELRREGTQVLFALSGDADPLIKRLAVHTVRAIDSHEADLEDIFLSLYGSEGEG